MFKVNNTHYTRKVSDFLNFLLSEELEVFNVYIIRGKWFYLTLSQ